MYIFNLQLIFEVSPIQDSCQSVLVNMKMAVTEIFTEYELKFGVI